MIILINCVFQFFSVTQYFIINLISVITPCYLMSMQKFYYASDHIHFQNIWKVLGTHPLNDHDLDIEDMLYIVQLNWFFRRLAYLGTIYISRQRALQLNHATNNFENSWKTSTVVDFDRVFRTGRLPGIKS